MGNDTNEKPFNAH
jgi:hypothetical protein